MQTNSVLEQVLDMLQQIADQPGDNEIDMMLVLMRLQQIERVILMLAPVGGSAGFAPCLSVGRLIKPLQIRRSLQLIYLT